MFRLHHHTNKKIFVYPIPSGELRDVLKISVTCYCVKSVNWTSNVSGTLHFALCSFLLQTIININPGSDAMLAPWLNYLKYVLTANMLVFHKGYTHKNFVFYA